MADAASASLASSSSHKHVSSSLPSNLEQWKLHLQTLVANERLILSKPSLKTTAPFPHHLHGPSHPPPASSSPDPLVAPAGGASASHIQSRFLRIPLCVELMETMRSFNGQEDQITAIDDMIDAIVQSHCSDIPFKEEDADIDLSVLDTSPAAALLSSHYASSSSPFSGASPSLSSSSSSAANGGQHGIIHRTINWRAIVLKLHQVVLETNLLDAVLQSEMKKEVRQKQDEQHVDEEVGLLLRGLPASPSLSASSSISSSPTPDSHQQRDQSTYLQHLRIGTNKRRVTSWKLTSSSASSLHSSAASSPSHGMTPEHSPIMRGSSGSSSQKHVAFKPHHSLNVVVSPPPAGSAAAAAVHEEVVIGGVSSTRPTMLSPEKQQISRSVSMESLPETFSARRARKGVPSHGSQLVSSPPVSPVFSSSASSATAAARVASPPPSDASGPVVSSLDINPYAEFSSDSFPSSLISPARASAQLQQQQQQQQKPQQFTALPPSAASHLLPSYLGSSGSLFAPSASASAPQKPISSVQAAISIEPSPPSPIIPSPAVIGPPSPSSSASHHDGIDFSSHHFPVDTVQLSLFPECFDFIIHWGGDDNESEKKERDRCGGISIPLKHVLVMVACRGLLDSMFVRLLICGIQDVKSRLAPAELGSWRSIPVTSNLLAGIPPSEETKEHSEAAAAAAEGDQICSPSVQFKTQSFLDTISQQITDYHMNEDRYETYLLKFLSSKERAVLDALKDLERDVQPAILSGSSVARHLLERLLISLMGHVNAAVRESAVKLLNVLYDGHTWQTQNALPISAVKCIGDAFTHSIAMPAFTVGLVSASNLYVQICRPSSPSTLSVSSSISSPATSSSTSLTASPSGGYVFLLHPISASADSSSLSFESGRFDACGFYDWRLVAMQSNGSLMPIDGSCGRFVVQPPVRQEVVHEIWVDAFKAKYDVKTSSISQRGTFADITASMESFARSGITTLHILGALERCDLNPFAPTDRSRPLESAGGVRAFKELVQKAHQHRIKILVDATLRISARRAHRKYKSLTVQTTDQHGRSMPHFCTDGSDIEWQDSVLLNYRKQESWDMLLDDAKCWVNEYGVDGFLLDHAHTWPPLLEPDLEELMRLDADSEYHYDLQEILNADVVIPTYRVKRTLGFWGTKAASEYAHPMMVRFTRDLWSVNPSLAFWAEVYWNRESQAIRSGLLPHAARASSAVSSIFHRTASASHALSQWYDSLVPSASASASASGGDHPHHRGLPQGSILALSSSSHHQMYPCIRFGGNASFAHADLLFTLPEVPKLYQLEPEASSYSIDIQTGQYSVHRESLNNVKPDVLREHYKARTMLRAAHPVLTSQGQIRILTPLTKDKHEIGHVAAYARFFDSSSSSSSASREGMTRLAIVAVNCCPEKTVVTLDMSSLRDLLLSSAAASSWTGDSTQIVCISDLAATLGGKSQQQQHNARFYTMDELIQLPPTVELAPYTSIMWKVDALPETASNLRLLYESSQARLRDMLWLNEDATHNHFFKTLTSSMLSPTRLAAALDTLGSVFMPANPHDYSFATFVHEVLFRATRNNVAVETTVMTALQRIISSTAAPSPKFPSAAILPSSADASPAPSAAAQALCKKILETNTLGPIIFITPEIAPWTTTGGVAIMVDELTQDLARLGLDVSVVSPFYHWNKYGKTDYLAVDGFTHKQNIVTYVGDERAEMGVHYAKRHGVNYYFMHHQGFFPAVYHTGTPVHQLQMCVAMAKGSLELLCQLKVLPALVVTNDWFTGLVPGYARAGEFGSVFSEAIFLHIVHNLEVGYQGHIYPDAADSSMLRHIHRLPEHYVVDHVGSPRTIDTSRCALLTSTQWATVSESYKNDLLHGSAQYGHLLRNFPRPFAFSNGIRVADRMEKLRKGVATSHAEAKFKLQSKYFPNRVDASIPVLCFVGRITSQKGVLLLLNAVRELIDKYQGRIQILVGGQANKKEPYAAQCAWAMMSLRDAHPDQFWASPDEYFTDGGLVNYGSDIGIVPSLFEPSGVVQQEFFLCGTPVIAFWTGGLKDTVFEYSRETQKGNGFVFMAHQHGDFVYAVERALNVYYDEQQFAKLRENAAASVLDTLDVGRAWGREFCRLRRKMWPEATLMNAAGEDSVKSFEDGKVGNA